MPFLFSIVPEYKRLIHFRFGHFIGEKGPGLIFPIIPVIDQVVRVDLREIWIEVEPQTCITQDNASVAVDMLIYMRIVDSKESVIKVQDFEGAARGIAITTLRAVVGDIPLDDVLAKRDHINQIMQTKLDEVTGRWGVKVTAVEIREIQPPRDILEAMSRQMSAERNRRAMVTEADGQREAAIKVAEGAKQSAILEAEGQRQAAILRAEGSKQAKVLEAEGFSAALNAINDIAKGVQSNTMGLQYLDTLNHLAEGMSTKWVIPLEFTRLLQGALGATGDGSAAKTVSSDEEGGRK
jgi:regulator of protease activity HflC (stomatin/prohibitin superfamily)